MKKTLLSLSLLLGATLAGAAERSLDTMKQIAAAQLSKAAGVKAFGGRAATLRDVRLVAEDASYGVFSPEDGEGYVIVAKSDKVRPVLGYAASSFPAQDMPDGLRWFLTEMSLELQAAEAGQTARAPRRANATYTPVDNFITTQWSQEYPFNRLTPNTCPSGCVATALAQVLNYCQWPQSASFEGNYYLTTTQGRSEKTTFETVNVSTTYTWPYQDTYKSIGRVPDNIDELLRDCGYAVYMQYTSASSGAMMFMSGIALTTIFGYPETCIKYLDYDYCGDHDVWAQTIYDELALRSPVLYGASDASYGGHAFIFSGVDEDGLVYVNWGWRGTCDGFYAITELNPVVSGDTKHFTDYADMVFGIRVNPLPTDHVVGWISSYSGRPFTFRWGTAEDDAGVEHPTLYADLPYGFINCNASEFQGVFGLFAEDLTDGSSWVIAPDLQDRDTIPAGYGYGGSSEAYKDVAFYYFVDGAGGLQPGHTYRMSFGVKDDREGVWHSILCSGGELAYEVTYTGDPATSTVSAERTSVPVLDAIADLRASNPADASRLVRVYDLDGRCVYASPRSSFNLWDVPARGVLVVKDGQTTRKVIR